MPQLTTNKLRRSPTEMAHAAKSPSTSDPVSWQGLSLDDLGQMLAQTHHEKIIWKGLATSISSSLEDQAVAFVQHAHGEWTVLSEDGVHEQLRDAIVGENPLCPFLRSPERHVEHLSAALAAFPEAAHLYEFIEHYWGWRLPSEIDAPIYMMIFGSEQEAPSALALSASVLASYVCANISSEKGRQQLIADLSAETQGLRISAAAALRRRLEQWTTLNDGAK